MALNIKTGWCVLIAIMILFIPSVSGAMQYSVNQIREQVSYTNIRQDTIQGIESIVASRYSDSTITEGIRINSDSSILQSAIFEDQLLRNIPQEYSMDPETPWTPLDEPIPQKFVLFSSTGSDSYSVRIDGYYAHSFIPHLELTQRN